MKEDNKNIINLAEISGVRNSLNTIVKLPSKNSVVKLTALEYLKKGIKVSIEGKIFIAFIENKIPLKEEIIAVVTSSKPFLISLDLTSILKENEKFLLDNVIRKLHLPNNETQKNIIKIVINEGNNISKLKIIQLSELLKNIKASGLELSLLINLVWNNNEKDISFIEQLYDNLFEETFEKVCLKLFEFINELLFSNLPQYLVHKISSNFIYTENSENTKALLNKTNSLIDMVKLLNDFKNLNSKNESSKIENFIYYATKYILQKSILKDYDYYPDFVLIKREDEISIISFSIKKIYDKNNSVSYKVLFKHEQLPFNLTGIIRENFLSGNLNIKNAINDNEKEIESFQDKLLNNWGINSDLRNCKSEEEFGIIKQKLGLNKLVS